ncbi:MAG: hypothetical protein IPL91_01975 [Hyphomicrobium sp.]|nr:hypothetical protein [Hyphomicrobium sp.]
MFAGRPLLAHSIVQAKNSGQFDCVACSSDDERYLAIAMEAGADLAIKRPGVGQRSRSQAAGSASRRDNSRGTCRADLRYGR